MKKLLGSLVIVLSTVLAGLLALGIWLKAQDVPDPPVTAGTQPSSTQTAVTTKATLPTTTAVIPTTAPVATTVLATTGKEPADTDFVRVTDYIPDVLVELKYATADNFTGAVIYDFQDAYLRYGTVKKLMQVQSALKEQGLRLKIWDGFRPTWAQFRLWEICPDPDFVSDPNVGFSNHSRGNTVDVTLVDSQGREVTMPTGFDDFSDLADRDYSDCPADARQNALLLENLMLSCGFNGYREEWWHFTDETVYEVETEFTPE